MSRKKADMRSLRIEDRGSWIEDQGSIARWQRFFEIGKIQKLHQRFHSAPPQSKRYGQGEVPEEKALTFG